jgi:hypothetical protein
VGVVGGPYSAPHTEELPVAGRKPLEIDLDQVEHLAGLGLSEAAICASLGISPDTLARRKQTSADFAAALKRGKAFAHQQVAAVLFDKALEGDVGAIVWWEKTRAGLSDRVTQEHTGAGGGPLVREIVVELPREPLAP